jgi:peptide deformylase
MILKERPKTCTLTYQDIKGIVKKEALGPMKTRIVLHEYDHLQGLDLYKTGIIYDLKKLEDFGTTKHLNYWVEKEKAKGYIF